MKKYEPLDCANVSKRQEKSMRSKNNLSRVFADARVLIITRALKCRFRFFYDFYVFSSLDDYKKIFCILYYTST